MQIVVITKNWPIIEVSSTTILNFTYKGEVKMKKLFLLCLVSLSLLLFTFFPNIQPASAKTTPSVTKNISSSSVNQTVNQNINLNVNAKLLSNVQKKAGDIDLTKATDREVVFSDVDLSGSNVNEIKGYVFKNQNKKIPFDLEGQLYKGVTSARINGSLKDKTGNFEIVRFEINNDPAHGVFLNKSLKKTTVAIYLHNNNKQSRNLTIIEIPAEKLFGKDTLNNLYKQSESFEEAPNNVVLWFEKYFTPDKKGHSVNKPNNGIQPLTSVSSHNYYVSYYDYYYIFGYYVNDTIKLQEKVTVPSDTYEDIKGRLTVYSTDYDESNGTDIKNDVTGFRIGGEGVLGIKLQAMSAPEVINWENIDGSVVQSGSVQFTLSLSYSYLGLSAGLSYSNAKSVDLSQGNYDCNGAGVCDMYSSGGKYYMNHVNQYISANYDIAYDSSKGSHRNVTNYVHFIYNVYNFLEDFNWGKQDDYYSYSIYS